MAGASDSEKRIAVQRYIEQYEMFERFFREADEDNSGELDVEELVQIVKAKGYKGSEASIRGAFGRADLSGDGLISFEEYMVAMGFKLQKHHKGLLLWREMQSESQERYVKYVQLLKVLSQLTKHFSISEYQRIKATVDKYRDSAHCDFYFFILDLNKQRIISTASLPQGAIPPEVYIRFAELHGDVVDEGKIIVRQEATLVSSSRTEYTEWSEETRTVLLRWLTRKYPGMSEYAAFTRLFCAADRNGTWAVPVEQLAATLREEAVPHTDLLLRQWQQYDLLENLQLGFDQYMHSLGFRLSAEHCGCVLWGCLWPRARDALVDYWLALHMVLRLAPHLDETQVKLSKSAVERCRVDRRTVDLVLFLLELERLGVISLASLPANSVTSEMRQEYADFLNKLEQMKMLTSYQLHGLDDQSAHRSADDEGHMFEEWVEEKRISFETSSAVWADGFSLSQKYAGLNEYELYTLFFQEADTDGSGELDLEEVVNKLRKEGYKGSEDVIRKGFRNADLSGDNSISFEEYITAMGLPLRPTDKAMRFYRDMKRISPELQVPKADLMKIIERASKYFSSSDVALINLAANKVTNADGTADGWLFLLRLSDLGLVSLESVLAGQMPLDARRRLDIITGTYKEQATTEEWTVEQKIQYERTELELTKAHVVDEYDLYARFFTEADEDNSGELEIEELITKLRKEGYKGSENTIRSAFRRADTSGTGRVSFEEYMVAVGFSLRDSHKGLKFWKELVAKAGGKLVLSVSVVIRVVETVSRYFKASDSIEMKRSCKKIQNSAGDVDIGLLMLVLQDEGVVSTELLAPDAISEASQQRFDACDYPGGERRLARLEREQKRRAAKQAAVPAVAATQGPPSNEYDTFVRYFTEVDRSGSWSADARTLATKLQTVGQRGKDRGVQGELQKRAVSADTRMVSFEDYMLLLGFKLNKTHLANRLYRDFRQKKGGSGVLLQADDVTSVCNAAKHLFDEQDLSQLKHVTTFLPRYTGDWLDFRQWLQEVSNMDIIDLSDIPASVFTDPVSEEEIRFVGGEIEAEITQTIVREEQSTSGSGYSTSGSSSRLNTTVIDVTPTQATSLPIPVENKRSVAPAGDERTFVELDLKLHYITRSPGHSLAVVGSLPELGAWNPRHAVLAHEEPAESGWWHAHLTVPAETYMEWKWIVVPWTRDTALRWQNEATRQTNSGSIL